MVRRSETPTTIRDIARVLNVSHTTVSRVLNNQGNGFISEATRQRVMTAVREMNYRPNRAARKLATGRAGIIGVWIADVFHPYFATAIYHTEQLLRQHDLEMLHISRSSRPPHENDLNDFVDGILALDRPGEVRAYRKYATASSPPIVNMGCYICHEGDFVEVDLSTGTREAVTHLLESGCRRVAFLVPAQRGDDEKARYDTYLKVMEEWGREPEMIFLSRDYRAPARAEIKEYIAEKGCPDGIFCFNDDTAIGAYRGLRDLGIRIPDDVALIGCDGIEDTEYLDVPLSTIIVPYAELCARAWNLLKRRMENLDAPPVGEVISTALTVRESSRR